MISTAGSWLFQKPPKNALHNSPQINGRISRIRLFQNLYLPIQPQQSAQRTPVRHEVGSSHGWHRLPGPGLNVAECDNARQAVHAMLQRSPVACGVVELRPLSAPGSGFARYSPETMRSCLQTQCRIPVRPHLRMGSAAPDAHEHRHRESIPQVQLEKESRHDRLC